MREVERKKGERKRREMQTYQTCKESTADPHKEHYQPTRPSVPQLPGAPSPAELPVSVESLVTQSVSVPVPHPINGVEIIVVPGGRAGAERGERAEWRK